MTCGIAVALYNGTRFLEKQLDTIRLQTHTPDTVVLCDDGSKDHTAQLVRDYIQKYNLSDTWKLYQNQENLGYIRNFYKAMQLCDTDLIFLSDQDDIWKTDKIQQMHDILTDKDNILMLTCKYGIIDADGNQQYSIVEPDAKEDGSLTSVSVEDIMRAFRWPGMIMCLRREFFISLLPAIENCNAAHDVVLAVSAADRNGFYDYNYVGAYHRRHDNNTAKEEHRVSKLLNRQRKLSDIAAAKHTWANLLDGQLPLQEKNTTLIRKRLDLMIRREEIIRNRQLKSLIGLYAQNPKLLRVKSFLCDVWLVCFAK